VLAEVLQPLHRRINMREDVYNKIIEMCELAMNSISKTKSHEELGLQMISHLSMIIGVCGGAKESEKVG
jgi:hypothetical protein